MEIIEFDVIDSTQNYAKKMALDGFDDKVVCAKLQTAGRGRRENKWQSPMGGLWFSFITDISEISLDKVNLFTITLGIAIFEVCNEFYNTCPKLKWPNDLLLNNKKVVGILCERVNNKIVAGVGINTNVVRTDLIDCATSFLMETNISINNMQLLKAVLNKFHKLFYEFDKNNILKIFRDNMAYVNEMKFVSALNKEVLIKGIDNNCALVYEDNGSESTIISGIIEL